MSERYVCDRNGGAKAWYLTRKPWWCARCNKNQNTNGHRCKECNPSRRVCCACFHHDCGVCLDCAGDV